MKLSDLRKGLRNILVSSPVLGFILGYQLTYNILFDLKQAIYQQPNPVEIKVFRSITMKYPIIGGLIFAVIAWTFVAATYILVERSKKS